MTPFMFGTGIENSYPTIKEGSARVDEMEKCGHYKRWREDFALVQDLGIHSTRAYPFTWHDLYIVEAKPRVDQ